MAHPPGRNRDVEVPDLLGAMHAASPLVTLFTVFLLVASAPWLGAAAQEDREGPELLEHVNPRQLEIEAGQERVFDLVFEDGAFTGGWLFLFNGIAVQGAVDVSYIYLEDDGSEREIHTWTYDDDAYRMESTQMPWDGFYRLRVANNGDETARFVFFYDQACNCAAKPIPIELPQGMIVFNVDVQKGSEWRAVVPEPDAHQLRAFVAVRLDDRSLFPEDFGQVVESTQASVVDGQRVHVLDWEAKEGGRYYVFVHALRTDPDAIDRSDPPGSIVRSVMVIPQFERLSAPEEAPASGFILGLVGIGALMALGRRRR